MNVMNQARRTESQVIFEGLEAINSMCDNGQWQPRLTAFEAPVQQAPLEWLEMSPGEALPDDFVDKEVRRVFGHLY